MKRRGDAETRRRGETSTHSPLVKLLVGLAILIFDRSAGAADVVYLSKADGGEGRTRLSGTVVEYTGKILTVELAGGRRRSYAGARVQEIQSNWPAALAAAEAALHARRHQEAITSYREAARQEKRPWVRRRMTAGLADCYREQGQFVRAGELFLDIAAQDSATPYFDSIPLSWLPSDPPPDLVERSLEWLSGTDSPTANLLGASHLLTTRDRSAALDRLKQVAALKDPRLASLARAQQWRYASATATLEQLAVWSSQLETIPERLRAGPYLVVGRTQARLGRHQAAALTLLHVPVLFGENGELASEAFWSAGASLEKLSWMSAADHVYQELVDRYPETRAAVLMRGRFQASGGSVDRPSAESGTASHRFLAGLRDRRWFDLAALYCKLRLGEESDSGARIDLAIELSRTYVEHALQSPANERDPLWTEAVQAISAEPPGQKEHPRRVLLAVQSGLVHLARAEQIRLEAELTNEPQATMEPARKYLRSAAGAFDEAEELIEDLVREANQSRRKSADELSLLAVATLARNVRYQAARTHRNQGLTYPSGSPDRTNSLGRAVEILAALGEVDDADDVAWQSRLDEIACLRLLEAYPAAAARLAALDDLEAPPRVVLDARAERIRLALDRGQLLEALSLTKLDRAQGDAVSAELDFAMVQACLAGADDASRAGRADESAELSARAGELLQIIDKTHGPYWSRRVESLLAKSVSSADGGVEGSANPDLLTRAAESFLRAGQIDEAVATYDRAAEQAAALGDKSRQFTAAYAAAAVEQDRGRGGIAAERFRKLALAIPLHPKAQDAHLLAIFNTAKSSIPANRADAYLALLNEHIEHWPEAETAGQAWLWLGLIRQRRGEFEEAIQAFSQVPAGHPRHNEAVLLTGDCHLARLSRLSASGQPIAGALAEATTWFNGLLSGPDGKPLEQFDPLQRQAAVQAARLWLAHEREPYQKVEGLMKAVLNDASPAASGEVATATADWNQSAQGLLMLALAGQGHIDEAQKMFEALSHGDVDGLLGLVERMEHLAAADAKNQHALAEIRVSVLRGLLFRRDELDQLQSRAVELAFIRALEAADRLVEATEVARLMASATPRDGEVQEEYSRLLLAGHDAKSWQSALTQWRLVQSRSRPGGKRWLAAGYYQAVAHERLGQTERARQLIALTRSQYPELGGSDLKAKFEALARRLD